MLPRTIKIKVSWHCNLWQHSRKNSSMLGNPLFSGTFCSSIFQTLTSILPSPRALRRQKRWRLSMVLPWRTIIFNICLR